MFRFAIIGAGKIAHEFCDAVRRCSECEVSAVASKSAERAAVFAAEEGISASFGDYAAMLDECRPDAVYIATTHNFHYENILLCLSKKIPVLCEKPLVRTRKEAAEIFAEAEKQGVFVMEAMWSRFLPHIEKAREWIREGRIGTVELAHSVVAFRADYDPESRLFNPELAGGSLWDVGVYAIELLTYLLEENPAVVQTMVSRAPTGVDRAASVQMQFSNCIGTAQSGLLTCTPEGITISGSEGWIWLPHANTGREAQLFNRNRVLVEHFIEDYPNGFTYEVEETVRCVQEGLLQSPVVPWEDTLFCAGVFDQALSD